MYFNGLQTPTFAIKKMERSTSVGRRPFTAYIHVSSLAVKRNVEYQLLLKTSFSIFFGE